MRIRRAIDDQMSDELKEFIVDQLDWDAPLAFALDIARTSSSMPIPGIHVYGVDRAVGGFEFVELPAQRHQCLGIVDVAVVQQALHIIRAAARSSRDG